MCWKLFWRFATIWKKLIGKPHSLEILKKLRDIYYECIKYMQVLAYFTTTIKSTQIYYKNLKFIKTYTNT